MRTFSLILVLSTVCSAATLLVAAPSHATFKGANGLLVYQRQVGKHAQLFTVRPNGRGTRQVTHLADSDALSPAWSPDGNRIVFARDFAVGTPKEHLDIETINADGSGLHAFGLHGLNGDPVWSPDGRRILWLHAGGFAISNADGSGLRQVRVGGDNGSPTFSPDGKRVAFRRSLGGHGGAIYVVNSDGGGLKRLTMSPRGLADKIDWSPDGSRIVFSSPEFGPPASSNVYTIRVDGTGLVQLTHDRGGAINNGADSWSPDGQKIAFVSNRTGIYEIYVMNADGTGVSQLTRGSESHRAAWGTHP
jgi:TolB protein